MIVPSYHNSEDIRFPVLYLEGFSFLPCHPQFLSHTAKDYNRLAAVADVVVWGAAIAISCSSFLQRGTKLSPIVIIRSLSYSLSSKVHLIHRVGFLLHSPVPNAAPLNATHSLFLIL
jgi:hypothetical protein